MNTVVGMDTVAAPNRKLEFILKQVEHVQNFKRDSILDFSQLRMNEKGNLYTLDGALEDYRLTKWASGQLTTKIGIPFKYYEQCPVELRQVNVNHWLEKSESKNMMLRLREQGEEKVIRGIVSDKYSKFDNHEILGLVDGFLQTSKASYNTEMWRHDDDGFHLRLTFDHLSKNIGYTPDGEEDVHKVGIHIMNSEVGKCAVRIIPMVYRLVCSNGLMAWRSEGDIFSQRHLFITEETMQDRVAVAIGEALKVGEYTLDVLEMAKRKKVDKPVEVIEKIAKDRKYTKKLTESIVKQYQTENDGPQSSAFYVVQAFTAASRVLGEDMRVEVERDAANWLRDYMEAA